MSIAKVIIDDRQAIKNVQARAHRKLWAAIVYAAIDDAVRSNRARGDGAKQIASWARSRDGREVLSNAGIDPNERVVAGLQAFVERGHKTTSALSEN